MQRLVPIAVAAALAFACAQQPGMPKTPPLPVLASFDPVTSDPPPADPAFPAAIEEVAIASGESYMNGIVYVASGPGPHPVAILLHGYPGDEQNGDIAQALRRAGWDVLFFHYRGSWGSEGRFSFSNAREDVISALELVHTKRFTQTFRADPSRVVLVGHSMGGFLALEVGAADPKRALRRVDRRRQYGSLRQRRGRSRAARRTREGTRRLERADPRHERQEAGEGTHDQRDALGHDPDRAETRGAPGLVGRRRARHRGAAGAPSRSARRRARRGGRDADPGPSCSTPITPSPTSACLLTRRPIYSANGSGRSKVPKRT